MKSFGKKDIFTISVEYIDMLSLNPIYKGVRNFQYYGKVKFEVYGKDLFELVLGGEKSGFTGDVSILINFFTAGLYYQITEDEFPATGINATNALDKHFIGDLAYFSDKEEYEEIENEQHEMLEPVTLNLAKIHIPDSDLFREWPKKHSLNYYKEDTFLPDLFVSKSGNQIEFAYKTQGEFVAHPDKVVSLKYAKGIEFIDIALYKNTILEFCLDFIETFKDDYPDEMKVYKDNLKQVLEMDC